MTGWRLVKFELDESGERAVFFLSRLVDGLLEEFAFPGTYPASGIMVLSMDAPPHRVDGYIEHRNLFLYAAAAFRGQLDSRSLPIDLSTIPIQLTEFLVLEEMERRGEQDLMDLVDASNFSDESGGKHRSEVTLVCVAELHAAYIGSPKNELVSNFAASIPMDAPLRREIIGLSASQLADSCNLVLSESEFRSTAEKDSLLPIWEADMNDLIERLSG